MSDLPIGWSWKELRELASIVKGRKHDVRDDPSDGWLPYIGASAMEGRVEFYAENARGAVVAQSSDVLMLWDGERSGFSARGMDGVVGSTVARLRPRPDVDAAFLHHQLVHSFGFIQKHRTGTGVPHVPQDLKTLLVLPIPSEVEQQMAIAEFLDRLDSQVAVLRDIALKLEHIREGVLSDLLALGADGVASASTTSPDWQDAPWGRMPGHWLVNTLESMSARVTVGVVNAATHAYVEEGVPFVRSQNVRPNAFDTGGMLYVSESYNRSKAKSILRSGDVVIVRTGYPGTAAVVPPWLDGANCFSLLIVTPGPDLSPEYLAHFLNSPIGRREVKKTHFGSAQHNLNVAELKQFVIAVPPISEQLSIVNTLAQLDERIGNAWERMAKASMIRLGIMRDTLGSGPRPLLEGSGA